MARVPVEDTELAEMQQRAYRVLENNNASGSARALARDVVRLTILLQLARKGRGELRRRRDEIQRLNELFNLDLPEAE